MIDWTNEERQMRDDTERYWREYNAPFYRVKFALARVYVLTVGRLAGRVK